MKLRPAHSLVFSAQVLISCSSSSGPQPSTCIPPAAIQSHDVEAPASATTNGAETMSAESAEEVLISAAEFCDNHYGYANSPTAQVAAFNVLLDQSNAMSRFDRLAASESPVARLYALCAFQIADRQRFDRLLTELAPQRQIVPWQFGCIGGASAVGELAANIDMSDMGREFREARSH